MPPPCATYMEMVAVVAGVPGLNRQLDSPAGKISAYLPSLAAHDARLYVSKLARRRFWGGCSEGARKTIRVDCLSSPTEPMAVRVWLSSMSGVLNLSNSSHALFSTRA